MRCIRSRVASAASFTGFGDLLGGDFYSCVVEVSDDGSVIIVGYGYAPEAPNRAFLWEAGEGMLELGDLPGGSDHSRAIGISAAGFRPR